MPDQTCNRSTPTPALFSGAIPRTKQRFSNNACKKQATTNSCAKPKGAGSRSSRVNAPTPWKKTPNKKSSSKSTNNRSPKCQRLFRVTSFIKEKKTRFIFQDAATLATSPAISLYETFLNHTNGSSATTRNVLRDINLIYTWAKIRDVDLDRLLLCGQAPSPLEMRAMAIWLSENTASTDSYNTTLNSASSLFSWFVRYYGEYHGPADAEFFYRRENANEVAATINEQKRKVVKAAVAPDLTEEEVSTINAFLNPKNRKDVSPAVAIRDYLMWRLAIELGLRQGEILALRLCDCPHYGKDHIEIVRIEERGDNYFDPRGADAPQVKTLSRNIGFMLQKSPIPRLINDYSTAHRMRTHRSLGKVQRRMTDHQFLIINHQTKDDGQPLSCAGMRDVAATICERTGIHFHWHLARHALFNRLYAAVADRGPSRKEQLEDLIYLGGWRSAKSLTHYIRRARQKRAEKPISYWLGNNTWEALND